MTPFVLTYVLMIFLFSNILMYLNMICGLCLNEYDVSEIYQKVHHFCCVRRRFHKYI